jgi:hypothetical protein
MLTDEGRQQLIADQEGRLTHELPLRDLLPQAFLTQDLQG